MNLKDILLKKEELPIIYERCFHVPIHPNLINTNIAIDQNIASEVFPKAAKEWYSDLKEYASQLPEGQTKEWINEVFLNKKVRILKENGEQMLNSVSWRDQVINSDNGFARSLSISRNSGGTLYFTGDRESTTGFTLGLDNGYIRFSDEKAKEFSIGKIEIDKREMVQMYIYQSHNIDHYPGALFLRNWAILYLNEAIKQVLK